MKGWARWRAAWLRLVSRPSFQARASGFWLTRPVALRRTRALFDLTAGFVYSQTVLVLVRLGVLETLLEAPVPEARLARDVGVAPGRFARLVDAAEALELVRRRRGRLELGPLGAPLAGNAALRALVEHNAVFYRDLADPVALLRGEAGTELSRYWPYAGTTEPAGLPPEAVAGYSELMARSQPLLAAEVLDAFDFGRHRRLVDLGGGAGVFIEMAGERHPHLERTLVDLPAVAALARARLGERGDEARVVGTDFLRGPLPGGFDVATLVRILHDHDDEEAALLLRRLRDEVLVPGGSVVVAEPMSGVLGSGAVGPAYFSLYLLAMGRGRPRTPERVEALLVGAGFRRVRRLRPRAPVVTSIVVARAP